MAQEGGGGVFDPRISQANRDMANMQSLNDDLKVAYQEVSILCEQRDEEITALRQKISDLEATVSSLQVRLTDQSDANLAAAVEL